MSEPPPAELRARRSSSWERVPNLTMGIVALFLGVFWVSVTLYPQQAYPEYAARWQLMLAVMAALAVAAVYAQGLTLGAGFYSIFILGFLLTPISYARMFPWAGTDWMATMLQGYLAMVIGAAFGAHFAKRGAIGNRLLAAAILVFVVGLTLFYLADAAHQQLVRFPREIALLQSTASTEVDWLLLDALQRGRLAGRFGNPNVLAGALCMLWPVVVAGWMAARATWLRLFLAAIAAGWMPALLWATGSRGGLLTALGIVSLTALVWRRDLLCRRVARDAAIGFAVGVVTAMIVSVATPATSHMNAPGTEGNDATGRFSRPSTIAMRLGFLEAGWRMATDSTVRGGGPGSYEALYPRYRTPGRQESKYAHNWPLQFVVEWGAIQSLFLGLFLLILPKDLWQKRKSSWAIFGEAASDFGDGAPVDLGQLVRYTPVALLLVAAAFWGNGLVEITTYMREPMILAMAALGIVTTWGFWRMADAPDFRKQSDEEAPSFSARMCDSILLPLLIVLSAFGTFGKVQPRVEALGLISAARQGPLIELQEHVAEGRRFVDLGAAAEIADYARRAAANFPESPEPAILLADTGDLLAAARAANLLPGAALAEFEPETFDPEHQLRAALHLMPTSAALHARLARLQSDRGEALELVEEAMRLHPAEPDYKYQAATILLGEGTPEAIVDLDRARALLRTAIEYEYRENRIAQYRAVLDRLGGDQ